jgi:hypothetical protein
VKTNHKDIFFKWVINLNINIDHLGYEFNDQHVWVTHMNMELGVCSFVTHEACYVIVNVVKQQASIVCWLIDY